MVNVNVLSMEELSTSLETIGWKLFSFANRLEKMACKIQCQKKVSFRFCIDKYSISAFVFVLTHLLSSPFKTISVTLPVKHLKILHRIYVNAQQWQNHEDFLSISQNKLFFY